MCGIAGILLAANADRRRLAAVDAMTAALRHRGPDGDGIWTAPADGIALGHRRLAIVDLSEAGRQPMESHGGRLVTTFNGEIYNFADLRRDLERAGHGFRGHGDTEVMLAAFERFGIEAALKRFAGMFALAVWDRRLRTLHLVRDRIGKKPLYVALARGALLFASELKAIRAFPDFEPTVDAGALATVLRRGWVPDDQCIFEGAFKLPPGSVLSVRAEDLLRAGADDLRGRVRRWWSLAAVAESGRRDLRRPDAAELEGQLDLLLRMVVRDRMVADVPLGAFLSGGIDSSMVVALMQAQSSRPVRTFTIGFGEAAYDEASHAARIAGHLGTEHTEFRLTPAEALAAIPQLPDAWDEPFADESQVPTLLLSRLARRHVTVALSGDGGDECFGGYARHFMLSRLAGVFALPPPARRIAAYGLRALLGALLPASGRAPLAKLARLLAAGDEDELYETLLAAGAGPPSGPAASAAAVPALRGLVDRVIFRDMAEYLPGDILVKLDRASMAASLEARCPFLDHRMIEFAWRLPTAVKIRAGRGKWLLRRVLSRYLPPPLFERPKQGFNVPVAEWLKGPLRDWARDLIDPSRLRRDGLLDAAWVENTWRDHQSGRGDRSRELWAILMVQAWLATLRKPPVRHPSIGTAAMHRMETGVQ